MKNRKYIGWLIVIFIMLIIYYFSDMVGSGSSTTSNGITSIIYDLLKLDNVIEYESFHALIRKLAHFLVYFVLGFFIFNAYFYTLKNKLIWILIFSVGLVLCYAITDEVHQLFVPGRDGNILDIIIDTSGGSLGAMIYYLCIKIGMIKDDLQKR